MLMSPPAMSHSLTPAQALPNPDAPAEPGNGCGWFDSSLELQQGLAVQEWPADDWAVAALFFAQRPAASARWQ